MEPITPQQAEAGRWCTRCHDIYYAETFSSTGAELLAARVRRLERRRHKRGVVAFVREMHDALNREGTTP